jgi:parallel beta-helix repeat protein
MLNVAFDVHRARAIGIIYIRADGSIDPVDAPISTFDNVTYTLIGNIASIDHGMVVERDDIVVDGAGYSVIGSGIGQGITLIDRSNVTMRNITIRNFASGIYLDSSVNNTLSGNNVVANSNYGIFLYSSSGNNVLSGNNVANNLNAIRLISSNNNVLSGNNVANNYYGIYLHSSSNSVFSGNNVTANNGAGIGLDSSPYNTLFGNNLANNRYGFNLYLSYDNMFYHNNFIDNTQHVYVESDDLNVWDDGYPSGGNYWSDYNGTDANHDGIGGTPYVIDAYNSDEYPLMVPHVIPEFPSLLILPLFFIATLLAATIGIRKKERS